LFASAFCFTFFLLAVTVLASHHYTEKQLDSLAARVGRTFWIVAVNHETPLFLSAPSPHASSFAVPPNLSFEVLELVGRREKNPYYKVRFESGREGFIAPERFHEGLNWTIVTSDPQAEARRKAALQAEEEKKRVEWIQAQPWSRSVKEATIKRRPVLGLSTAEVKKALGDPTRAVKSKGPQRLAEEQWFYPDGSVLIFINGLLSRVESVEKKQP
jgi:hypothetical protein